MLAIPAVLVVTVVIAFLVFLLIAMQDQDGDDLAVDRVEHVADALAKDLSDIREPIDAETVAAEWFRSTSATIEPLTWTGTVGPDRAATIEARISASVAENSIGGFYGPFNSAGSAVRCYRYTVGLGEDASYEPVACEQLPTPSAPPHSNRPMLPHGAAERIEKALADSSSSVVADKLRTEFPGEEFTIEVTQTAHGDVVVAVGVSPGTDCILRVRGVAGDIFAPS